MALTDLKNGYESWQQGYGQHNIGHIEVKGMHYDHTSESSIEITIHKSDEETVYGNKIFCGTLEELVKRLEIFDCKIEDLIKREDDKQATT